MGGLDAVALRTGLARCGLQDARNLLVAVSGGPDSMALVHALHQQQPGRVRAHLVDHRLRPESTDEAHQVMSELQRHSIVCGMSTLQWAAAPRSNTQALARTERYNALVAAAHQHGCQAILTAHHADDQVETILMRICNLSGLVGALGIRARAHWRSERHGLQAPLARPLLHLTKADLVQYCQTNDVRTVNDCSNDSDKYERNRLRFALAARQQQTPDTLGEMYALAENWTVLRLELEGEARELAQSALHHDVHPQIWSIESKLVARAPRAVQIVLITACLVAVSGGRQPDPRQVEALVSTLEQSQPVRGQVGVVSFERQGSNHALHLWRSPLRADFEPLTIQSPTPAAWYWDGRFRCHPALQATARPESAFRLVPLTARWQQHLSQQGAWHHLKSAIRACPPQLRGSQPLLLMQTSPLDSEWKPAGLPTLHPHELLAADYDPPPLPWL